MIRMRDGLLRDAVSCCCVVRGARSIHTFALPEKLVIRGECYHGGHLGGQLCARFDLVT
jgi:hypothetical protein